MHEQQRAAAVVRLAEEHLHIVERRRTQRCLWQHDPALSVHGELRVQRRDGPAAVEDGDRDADAGDGVAGLGQHLHAVVADLVAADRDRLARRDGLGRAVAGGRPGDAREEQRGAEVRDVAGASRAGRERGHGGGARQHSSREERERDGLTPAHGQRGAQRTGSCCAARGERRARRDRDGERNEQRERDGRGERREEVAGHSDLLGTADAGDQRLDGADEHDGERGGDECDLERQQCVRRRLTSAVPPVPGERDSGDHREADDGCRECTTDRAILRERVHGRRRARARQRRPERGEQEAAESERGGARPGAPPLRRVQERGGGEERQQRGVLDRVPRPETTPPELGVCPVRACDHPEREQRPPREDPAPARGQPCLVQLVAAEGDERARERRRHRRQARVQDGRVVEHGRVLEDRREAGSLDGRRAEASERIGERHADQKEHARDAGEPGGHRGGPRDEDGDDREREHPEQQRALHPAPYAGEAVRPGGVAAAVVDDVGEAEVGRHHRPRERGGGERGACRGDGHRRPHPARGAGGEGDRQSARGERAVHPEMADHRHDPTVQMSAALRLSLR